LLSGKELPWPKAASVVGLFHIRMSPMAHRDGFGRSRSGPLSQAELTWFARREHYGS
jgi:hypothetical protein